MYRNRLQQAALAVIASFLASSWPAPAQRMLQIANTNFPCAEKLSYRVEWHGITAGLATVSIAKGKADEWQTTLDLQSAGMVSRLYNIRDKYKLTSGAKSCSDSSELEAEEGKHHKYEKLSFDTAHRKVDYYEHDLVKNQEVRRELDTPACTFEIVGALGALRTINLDPGRSINIPVTDGKKIATVRIDSQAKENVSIGGKNYATTRFEAYVFDNVLYRRKGRLEVWISDDGDHAPVQFRMQMGFPLGTVLVELEKDEPASNMAATTPRPDAS